MTRLALPLFAALLSLSIAPTSASAQCLDADARVDLAARIGLRVEPPHAAADLRAAADLAARARLRFEAGAELDALADLEQAWRLSGDADIAGMLGLSLRAAGRIPEAWLAMRAFLEGAAPDVRASLEARVRAAMGEIEAQLGGLALSGDLGARGQVWLDGRMIARLPLDASLGGPALRLAPGHVSLEIRADGRLAQTIEADLRAGAITNVEVDLPVVGVDADLFGRAGLVPLPRIDAALAADLAARGRAAFEAGALLEALVDLEAAFRATGDASLTGMLGLSLRAAGRLPEAWIALHVFLRDAPPAVRASLEARVRAAIGELDAQLGRLEIDGDVGARGQLIVDGHVVAQLPFDTSLGGALRLPPGHLRIHLRGAGRLAQELDVDVSAGALARVSADLPEVSIGAPSLAGPDVDASVPGVGGGIDPWAVVAIATGGVAVALVIAGIVASVVNDNLTADLGRLDCTATPALCDPIRGNLSVSEAFEWVGYLGAGIGAAVAATIGIVIAVTANATSSAPALGTPDLDVDADVDLGCDEDEDVDDRRTTSISAVCAPWVADGAGVGCSMAF